MTNLEKQEMVYNLSINKDSCNFSTKIYNELESASLELQKIEEKLKEDELSISKLTPNCEKIDYILAITSGAICGLIDIFLIGSPSDTVLGEITDEKVANLVKKFAHANGWEDKNNHNELSTAISYLEKKYKIPYDQTVGGDIFKQLLDLNTYNHHFKSLGHNPSILGLFFSILNQFTNTSSFVSNGEYITLTNSDSGFELNGNDVPSKLLCGFTNWLGHIISDVSGSSSSKGRGMGIPSPLWTWVNDLIVIKRKLNIPSNEFDRNLNDFVIEIYKNGYDIRFQTAQLIPVFINECLTRIFYSLRRMMHYYKKSQTRSFKQLWSACEPFSNSTVKRMLTVAHGTFCLLDVGDATIRSIVAGGGTVNIAELVMNVNIAGIGRFSISLYGENKRDRKIKNYENEVYLLKKEKSVISYYVDGLTKLSIMYDDILLLNFVKDLKDSSLYKEGFQKTIQLADKRNVDTNKTLRNKNDIDNFFKG